MTEQQLHTLAVDIKNGDDSAEEQLARYSQQHYVKSIFTVAQRYGFTNKDDVLDIYQETFSTLLAELRDGTYQGGSFSAFVYGICQNYCRNRLRTLKTQMRGGDVHHVSVHQEVPMGLGERGRELLAELKAQANHLLESQYLHKNPLEHLTERERWKLIKECIEAMKNADYRKVFELLLDSHDRNEISNLLHIPLKRVDEMMNYGKKVVKKCVEQK